MGKFDLPVMGLGGTTPQGAIHLDGEMTRPNDVDLQLSEPTEPLASTVGHHGPDVYSDCNKLAQDIHGHNIAIGQLLGLKTVCRTLGFADCDKWDEIIQSQRDSLKDALMEYRRRCMIEFSMPHQTGGIAA